MRLRSFSAYITVTALDSVSDLLSTYGGHAAAAGFSAAASAIASIREGLNSHVVQSLGGQQPVPESEWMIECSQSDLTMKLAIDLLRLGPLGKSNPQPVLFVPSVIPSSLKILKDKHLKFKIGDCDGLWWNASSMVSR